MSEKRGGSPRSQKPDDPAESDPTAGMDQEESSGTTIGAIISFILLVIVVFAFKHSVLDANNIPSGSMIPTLKVGDYLFVNRMRYSLRIPFTNVELMRIDNPERGDIITFIPPNDEGKQYVKRVIGIPGDRIRIRNISVCNSDLKIARSLEADYDCNSSPYYRVPVLAIVEFKPAAETDEKRDAQPWQTFSVSESNAEEAKMQLTDSDDADVLHPEMNENPSGGMLPVLFRAQTGNSDHFFVEKSDIIGAEGLCDSVEKTGCIIPHDHYFVMGDNRDGSKDSRFMVVGYIGRERILGKPLIVYFSIDWKDQICAEYMRRFHRSPGPGFPLENFPPDEQRKYCTDLDSNAAIGGENISGYVIRTLFYRIPRMSVRWKRIGTLLE